MALLQVSICMNYIIFPYCTQLATKVLILCTVLTKMSSLCFHIIRILKIVHQVNCCQALNWAL